MAYELFIDGFDHYNDASILVLKWPYRYGALVSSGNGRRGTNALTLYSPGFYLGRPVSTSAKGVIAAAVKFTTPNRTYFSVYDGSTRQIYLLLTSDQRLQVAMESTVLATSTNVISLNTYYYVEFGFHINNSGSFEVRVNGSSSGWIPSTNSDTQRSGNASFNAFYFGDGEGYYDDVYCTFGDEIKFLGDSRVDTLALTANSTPQDWTPDTGNAWERLNQDAGYISSGTVDAVSLFAAGDISHNPSTIHGIQLNGHAYKSDAGSREAALVLKSGATTDVGDSVALSTNTLLIREPYIVDPNTGSAFTKSNLNAIEVGVKVAA